MAVSSRMNNFIEQEKFLNDISARFKLLKKNDQVGHLC